MTDGPMYPESAQREQQGVAQVQSAVVALKWIFRHQPVADTGIDAFVEVVEDGHATGRLIALQIKCGKSFFSEPVQGGGWRFRGELKHLDYWRNYALPVIVVICDPDSGDCYWVDVGPDADVTASQKSWSIVVPEENRLGPKSAAELRSVAEGLSRHQRQLARLESDTDLMRRIAEGREIRVVFDEWVNKSSGRGDFTIVDVTSGTDEVITEWIGLAPGWDYEELLRHLFPWAEVTIDEGFYEPYDEARFSLEYGHYDKEDDRYYHSEDFGEWLRSLPTFRPYEEMVAGEVDRYRLTLSLNEVGRAWLTIQAFAAGD